MFSYDALNNSCSPDVTRWPLAAGEFAATHFLLMDRHFFSLDALQVPLHQFGVFQLFHDDPTRQRWVSESGLPLMHRVGRDTAQFPQLNSRNTKSTPQLCDFMRHSFRHIKSLSDLLYIVPCWILCSCRFMGNPVLQLCIHFLAMHRDMPGCGDSQSDSAALDGDDPYANRTVDDNFFFQFSC